MGAPGIEEAAEQYDVIHVNFTTAGLGLIGDLAQACRSTNCKLVVNVDYAVEMWNTNIHHPTLWLRELDKADLIFHVEPRGAELLEAALQRPVPVIPHPIDTNGLLAHATKEDERSRTLNCLVHRYDLQVAEPWLLGLGLKKRLPNVTVGVTLCAEAPPDDMMLRLPYMYDWLRTRQPYAKFVELLSRSWAVYDSYNFSSFGRTVGECAALAIPCVGHDCCYAQKALFPKLTFERSSQFRKLETLAMLFESKEFYKDVAEYAFNGVRNTYSYEASASTMLRELKMVEISNGNGRVGAGASGESEATERVSTA